MGRREELERELEVARMRLEEAPQDTPKAIREAWVKEMDSISFELNNLYDDNEIEEE